MVDQRFPLNASKPSEKSPKRRMLRISEKVELIKLVENSPKNKKNIAAMFGIPVNTVGTIYANRERILRKCKSDFTNMNLKRLRSSSYPDIEEKLLDWCIENHAANNDNPVTCLTLRTKALQVAKSLGHDNFSASNGWIERFKARHNLKFRRTRSKKLSSNFVTPSINNKSVDSNKSDISLGGNSSETETFKSMKSKIVWKNVASPMTEMIDEKKQFENSCTQSQNYHTSALISKICESEECSHLSPNLIPKNHLNQIESCNKICVFKEFPNDTITRTVHSNLSIQEVDDAFNVILTYVKQLDKNISEKTHDALTELEMFISNEKARKMQSKITDYFSFV